MSVLRRNRQRSPETVVEFSTLMGLLIVRIDGNCPDCELSPATFMPAIEAHLKLRLPEVREVRVASE